MAEKVGDDAFNEFAEGAFQRDGVVCIGFGVIWFSGFRRTTVVVDLKVDRKWVVLMEAWIRVWRCREVRLKVFFSVILAISSRPGAFLGDILLMACDKTNHLLVNRLTRVN
jgi:hypothetical protein